MQGYAFLRSITNTHTVWTPSASSFAATFTVCNSELTDFLLMRDDHINLVDLEDMPSNKTPKRVALHLSDKSTTNSQDSPHLLQVVLLSIKQMYKMVADNLTYQL